MFCKNIYMVCLACALLCEEDEGRLNDNEERILKADFL